MCVKKEKKVFLYGHIWRPKWPSSTIWQNMYGSIIVCEIIGIYYFFKTQVYGKFFTELEFHKKWHGKFESYFFKKKKFKLYGKLKFKKYKKLLNILQTGVYC